MTDVKKEQDPKKGDEAKPKDGKKDAKAPAEEELVISYHLFSNFKTICPE